MTGCPIETPARNRDKIPNARSTERKDWSPSGLWQFFQWRSYTEPNTVRPACHHAWALRMVAATAAHPADFRADVAEARYREAMYCAREFGMRPLVAQCHAGLAKLYARIGKPEQGDEHFDTATAMYREMGMTYWLEKAEAQRTA
jgi:hypothetical protein